MVGSDNLILTSGVNTPHELSPNKHVSIEANEPTPLFQSETLTMAQISTTGTPDANTPTARTLTPVVASPAKSPKKTPVKMVIDAKEIVI